MSDISISERRLSAALDRIDQYLDRGGIAHGSGMSDLRAELEAAQARIAELTEQAARSAPDGGDDADMAAQAARLAAANDELTAANRALIAAMAGEDDRIEAVSLALEAEIEALRAARAADSAQLASLLVEVERLLDGEGGDRTPQDGDDPALADHRRDAEQGNI